jgi:hypothetical protein
MALPQSALSELFEVFRTGEGTDFIRECVNGPSRGSPNATGPGRGC